MPPKINKQRVSEVDEVAQWFAAIKLGIKWRYRTSGADDRRWTLYKRYYKGDWGGDWSSDIPDLQLSDYLPVNLIFSYIRSIAPNVFFKNPGVLVTKGLIVDGVDDRDVIQDVADYLVLELGLKQMAKRVVLSTLLSGTGVLKEGYGSQFIAAGEGESTPTRRIEYSSRVKPGLPWASDIPPTDFVVPWGTKLLEDAPWCAHRVWRKLDDAQVEKRYKHRDRIVATAGPRIEGGDRGAVPIAQEPGTWAEMWEVHDKATGKLIILSEGSKLYHYNDSDVLQVENLPFRTLVFNENLDTMWGISVVGIMEPQQLELNDVRTQEAEHRRREVTKWALDPNGEINKETSSQLNDATTPMAVVKVNDPNKNLMLLSSSMPRDLPAVAQEIINDLRFEAGYSRNQSGDVSEGRRTAYEIEIARAASETRNGERRDLTAEMFGRVVGDILQYSFKFMSEAMVRRITNGRLWHPRNVETLPYDFGIQVNPEMSRPVSTELMKRDSEKIYLLLQNNPFVNQVASTMNLLAPYNLQYENLIDPEVARLLMAWAQAKMGGGQGEERRQT